MNAPRARRVPVVDREPLVGNDPYDYADAFEIHLREPDARSAAEFVRRALEQAPGPIRWTIRIVHRHVLWLQLGPPGSPDHLSGWRIVTSEHDVIQLEALSPWLGRAVIVARRSDPTSAVLTTYLFYKRPIVANVVWTLVGPLHRLVAPRLLEYSAAHADRGEVLRNGAGAARRG